MSDYPDVGALLVWLFRAVIVLAPLALWKLGELVWWVVSHVRLGWEG